MNNIGAVSPEVVLLGAGNLATGLALSMCQRQMEVRQIYSRTPASAQLLKERMGQEVALTGSLQNLYPGADLYICALKDDALPEVLRQIPSFGHGLWVHTSGTLPMSVFQEFTDRYGVFYPLQTFSRSRPVPFDEIPICIEASDAQDLALLHRFALRLSGRVCEMDSVRRGVLHLAAVFANNFTNSLYATAKEILDREEIPFDLLLPLIDETARKVHGLDPAEAQTGPARRMDTHVLGHHVRMLESMGMERHAELYRELTKMIYAREHSEGKS